MGRSWKVSFAEQNPHLICEWSDRNKVSPCDVAANANKKYWFTCNLKNHRWQDSPSKRTTGAGCPYCANRRVSTDNCLATTHPQLAAEWHPINNGSKTPYNVVGGSGKKWWWKCSKGHEWEATLDNRTTKSRGCPYCTNQKVCIDNCLATTHPHIATEWHPTKNGSATPYDVIAGSARKYWFMCPKGHLYPSSLNHRTQDHGHGYGRGCPRCNESKGEKKIANILEKHKIPFKRQARFKKCRNKQPLPFDFIIFPEGKDPAVIEFHGRQHYIAVPAFGGAKELSAVQARDAIKRQFCQTKRLSLLEIPCWDVERINELLTKFIDSLPPMRKELIYRLSKLPVDS